MIKINYRLAQLSKIDCKALFELFIAGEIHFRDLSLKVGFDSTVQARTVLKNLNINGFVKIKNFDHNLTKAGVEYVRENWGFISSKAAL